MNATITMFSGKPQLPEVSKAEMARRLELFEIALREDKIAELERQLKEERKLTIKSLQIEHGSILLINQEPSDETWVAIQDAVNMRGLEDVAAIFGLDADTLTDQEKDILRQSLSKDLILVNTQMATDLQKANAFCSELENASNQLGLERDQALEKIQGFQATLVQQESDLNLLKAEIKEQHKEIKRLKALEPDRLAARVKRLKDDKEAQKEAINDLRASNKKVRTENRKLADALDNSIKQINSGEALKPLKVIEDKNLGRFEIFGTESVGHYTVMDNSRLTNQQVEILPAGTPDAPRPRPIPKAILNQVSALHTQLIKNAGTLA